MSLNMRYMPGLGDPFRNAPETAITTTIRDEQFTLVAAIPGRIQWVLVDDPRQVPGHAIMGLAVRVASPLAKYLPAEVDRVYEIYLTIDGETHRSYWQGTIRRLVKDDSIRIAAMREKDFLVDIPLRSEIWDVLDRSLELNASPWRLDRGRLAQHWTGTFDILPLRIGTPKEDHHDSDRPDRGSGSDR
jgi:hypothetical protein